MHREQNCGEPGRKAGKAQDSRQQENQNRIRGVNQNPNRVPGRWIRIGPRRAERHRKVRQRTIESVATGRDENAGKGRPKGFRVLQQHEVVGKKIEIGGSREDTRGQQRDGC